MRPAPLAKALLYLSVWLCLAGAATMQVQAAGDELGRALERVIASRGLEPLEALPLVTSPKFRLGQMLFFDPILSGTRDVACATCHLLGRGTSDGVALSVGVNAAGLAEERRPLGAPRVHPRNSMDLWNRGHPSVRNMFWDGRVSETEAPVSRFQTPMGDYLPDGIESVLAAQALFPLAGEEEMLGLPATVRHPISLAATAIGPTRLPWRRRAWTRTSRRCSSRSTTRSCAGSWARPAHRSPTGRSPIAGSSPRPIVRCCSAPSPSAISPMPSATSRNWPSSRATRPGTVTWLATKARSAGPRRRACSFSTARPVASPATAARSSATSSSTPSPWPRSAPASTRAATIAAATGRRAFPATSTSSARRRSAMSP